MNTELTRLLKGLEDAKGDLALYTRLIASEKLVEELTAKVLEARAKHDKAEAERKAAEREARFAGFGKITVEDATYHGSSRPIGEGLFRARKVICERPTWNPYRGTSEVGPVTYPGIPGTPPEVLAYLVEKHPEAIPADIMALCPQCPYTALDEYFVCRKRGSSRGPVEPRGAAA
jgi:hypothetical protein